MLPVIETVAAALAERAAGMPLVLDPVMVAKGGAPLIEPGALDALKRLLVARAAVLTPNLPEAEILCRHDDREHRRDAGRRRSLLALGCRAVLLKGGHLAGETVRTCSRPRSGIGSGERSRSTSRHTHGTGCTLASAIAAGLAQGLDVEAAVERARDYVRRAIATAPGIGRGHGPLDHGHPLRSLS